MPRHGPAQPATAPAGLTQVQRLIAGAELSTILLGSLQPGCKVCPVTTLVASSLRTLA
jgi:hypothetical protein